MMTVPAQASGSARGSLAPGVVVALAAGVLLAAMSLALRAAPLERGMRALSFWLVSLPAILVGFAPWRELARDAARHPLFRWVYAGFLVLALAPDRLVRGSVTHLAGPALYLAAALLLTVDRPRDPRPLRRDLLLVATLWLPLELGWIRGDFSMLRLVGVAALVLLFFIERPFEGFGLCWRFRLRDWGWAFGTWAVFLVPAIPIGLITGFVTPGLPKSSLSEWLAGPLLIYWVVALPEEALFRGVIQNLIHRAVKNERVGLAIAAVLFGLSHLNNGPAPDWRYVFLATMAGVAYGLTWLRTGTITAAAVTHALVDATWHDFFAR